eukprot:8993696-Pyramimonas_sp.AAC.1
MFLFLTPEAYSLCSEERGVRTELYESPGGNLVDGLPPVPVSQSAARRKSRPRRRLLRGFQRPTHRSRRPGRGR